MLQESPSRGGFGLPKWELYHQAAVLNWIRDWIALRRRRILSLEGHNLQQGWHYYLSQERPKKHKYFMDHFIRKVLMTIWDRIRNKYYLMTPIWLSPLEAMIHPTLYNRNKPLIYQVLLDPLGKVKSRNTLVELGYELDWWTYNQIQSRTAQDKNKGGIYNSLQELDKILLGKDEKVLSKLYQFLLMDWIGEEVIKDSMIAWGRNLGYSIELEKWEEIWGKTLKLTMSVSYKENIYKMLYRWHLPLARLSKMFPGTSPVCWKCNAAMGTYFHSWWTCPRAKEYWARIQKWILEIIGCRIDLNPETFLLGMKPENLNKSNWYLALHIIIAARISFAQEWKSKNIPSEATLIAKIMDCAEADKLTGLLRDRQESGLYRSWDRWYAWLQKKKS